MRIKIQVGRIYRAKNVLDEEECKNLEWLFETLYGPIVVERKRYWIAIKLDHNKLKVSGPEDEIYVTLFGSDGYEAGEHARMFGPVYRLTGAY